MLACIKLYMCNKLLEVNLSTTVTLFSEMQSEYGDLYKVTVATDTVDKGRVVELKVKYFDTVPPCSSICVLRTGFLFAASEFGNHALYQFQVGRQPT